MILIQNINKKGIFNVRLFCYFIFCQTCNPPFPDLKNTSTCHFNIPAILMRIGRGRGQWARLSHQGAITSIVFVFRLHIPIYTGRWARIQYVHESILFCKASYNIEQLRTSWTYSMIIFCGVKRFPGLGIEKRSENYYHTNEQVPVFRF